MKHFQNLRILGAALLVALLMVTLFGALANTPVSRAQGPNTLTARILRVTNYAIIGTDLTVNDDATVGDDLTADTGTFATGLTVSAGTVSLPTGSVGIGAIANISRTVSIPLLSFAECTTNAGALLSFTDGTDAHPHLANSSTDGLGYTLSFDATGGSVDTDYVCTQLPVPQDYVDGGVIVIRATKGAETGANSELITCQISVNGAALTTAGTIATSGTASAAYSCPPTLTGVTAGVALGITLRITSGGTADDAVNFQAAEFRYTATE